MSIQQCDNSDFCNIAEYQRSVIADLQKKLAEAKKEGAREILNKALRFECKEIDCSNCLEENDIVCAMNNIVRTYGVDEVIQKVEGL